MRDRRLNPLPSILIRPIIGWLNNDNQRSPKLTGFQWQRYYISSVASAHYISYICKQAIVPKPTSNFSYHFQTPRSNAPNTPLPRLRQKLHAHIPSLILAAARKIQHQQPYTEVRYCSGKIKCGHIPFYNKAFHFRWERGEVPGSGGLEDRVYYEQEVVPDEWLWKVRSKVSSIWQMFRRVWGRAGWKFVVHWFIWLRWLFRAWVWTNIFSR